MPNSLFAGSESQFCLTVFGASEDQTLVTMSLSSPHTGESVLNVSHNYTHGTESCQKFIVPPHHTYDMLLHNKTHIFHDMVKVRVHKNKPMTFIQTDKPIYKPGQTVMFRVLTVGTDLKPRTGVSANVYVIDAQMRRVKQYTNVSLNEIVSLDFELSPAAEQGSWTIFVEEEDAKTEVTFRVKEYVLPRFEVVIVPPTHVLSNQENFEGQVCANYTYGKPVQGYVQLKVCYANFFYSREGENCIYEVAKISGCYNFSANMSQLRQHSPRWHYSSGINIQATVTESGTGVIVNATQIDNYEISYTQLQIDLDDYTNGFFKPGLPYYGKVIVKRPDGSPAPGEVIRVTAEDYKNDLSYQVTLTTDSDGIVVFSFCGKFTLKSETISIRADAIEYKPHRDYKMETPTAWRTVRQWFSPSLSYIEIPRTEVVEYECGKVMTLNIPFTSTSGTDIDFTYQVISRSKIVKSGTITYNHRSNGGTRHRGPEVTGIPCLEDIPETSTESTTEPSIDLVPPKKDFLSPPKPEKFFLQNSNVDIFGESAPDEDHEPEDISHHSTDQADSVSSVLLYLDVTSEMSPSFQLVLYYIRPNGEIVADSMKFKVTTCFDNKVTMKLNKTEALPGEKVKMSLNASPGSMCGVGLVDKSVNLLGGKHRLSSSEIFNKLEYYIGSRHTYPSVMFKSTYEYCQTKIQDKTETADDDFSMGPVWFYDSPYADAQQAFQAAGQIVITDLTLETRPCSKEFPKYYDETRGPGGDKLLSGQPVAQIAGPSVRRVSTQTKTQTVRSHFPETWLWDILLVGQNGSAEMELTTPHTVTNWQGNAVCMESQSGLGVSELTSITTFQPFFLSINLPYAAVRGETLPVMVTVHNYLDTCTRIKIDLEIDSKAKVHDTFCKVRAMPSCLCPGQSHTVRYYVTPNDIGHVPVTAKAEILEGSCKDKVNVDIRYVGMKDVVRRNLFVKAEGVAQEYAKSVYICSNGTSATTKETIELTLPKKMVKDSQRGQINVIGDILGPALDNLDRLVSVPTGCGEQNMVRFVPNILVIDYLQSTGRLSEDLQRKAIRNMEIGYQRELNFQHEDGSYSAFGKKDKNGSVWLTAFVLKSFSQAKKHIFVDPLEVNKSIKFLKESQLENGCFKETGRVFSSYMMGGLGGMKEEKHMTLTSYVLIALLHAGLNSSDEMATSAAKCIERENEHENITKDVYSVAIATYAMVLLDSSSILAQNLTQNLNKRARVEVGSMHWSNTEPVSKTHKETVYHPATSSAIEMTSYALMAYGSFYTEDVVAKTSNIALWLSRQRNSFGGFSSTQDTVVGLSALSKYANLIYKDGPVNLRLTVTGEGVRRKFRVNSRSSLLLQTGVIRSLPTTVTVTAQGIGCALVSGIVQFNQAVKNIGEGIAPPFNLRVAVDKYRREPNRCDRRTITIHIGVRNRQAVQEMGLITVKMVTGWTPEPNSLMELEANFPKLGVKSYDYDKEEAILTFYLDEFTRKSKALSFEVEQDREMILSNPKPAEVKVFEYYETEIQRVRSYNIKTTCGTKEDKPHNAPENFFVDPLPLVRETREAKSSLLKSPEVTCPICSISSGVPKDIEDLVCTSNFVYKGVLSRTKKDIKIRQDLRPAQKKKLNRTVRLQLGELCKCLNFKNLNKKVIIFSEHEAKNRTLELSSTSIIFPTTRKLEREIRRYQHCCVKQ